MTAKRNEPPKRPVSRNVEAVKDDLNPHDTSPLPKWYTADQLEKHPPPKLKWTVPGLLPEGVGIIAGPPKIGKSAFALQLCVAVATGDSAFGAFDVEQGDVIYVSLEDGPTRIHARLTQHLNGKPFPTRLHLTHDLERLDGDNGFDLECHLGRLPDCRLVVLDTLQRIRPLSNRGSSQYEQDYDSVSILTRLANQYNTPILVVHHTREMRADSPLDKVFGSRGLVAAVDTILVVDHGTGKADVVMHTFGRDFPEAEHAFSIDFGTMTWRHLGDATVAQLPEDRRDIIAAVSISGPMTPTQIADATGLKVNNVKPKLKRMVNDGLIKNRGDGTYGPSYLEGQSNE